MCGGRETRQNAGLREEETACANGEYSAFLVWVFLLEVGESFDEAEGFGLGFEDCVGSTARDDKDVEFGEAGVSFLEVHMGTEASSLGGDGVFFG